MACLLYLWPFYSYDRKHEGLDRVPLHRQLELYRLLFLLVRLLLYLPMGWPLHRVGGNQLYRGLAAFYSSDLLDRDLLFGLDALY